MSLATGCASGGYKLTRQYAQWVNSNPVILRVILYIFTSFVFAITLLIDAVFFNTMDFWEGRVSAGDYQFKDGKRTFQVRHEYTGDHLRRSTIQVSEEGKVAQEVIIRETDSHEVELFVDGTLRSRVRGISELVPVASVFDAKGNFVSENPIFSAAAMARNTAPSATF